MAISKRNADGDREHARDDSKGDERSADKRAGARTRGDRKRRLGRRKAAGADERKRRPGRRKAAGADERKRRRKQPERKRGARRRAGQAAAAVREGGKATKGQTGDTPRTIGGRVGGAIGAVASLAFAILRGVWALLNRLLIRFGGPARRVAARLGSTLRSASSRLTPTRGIAIAAVGCAILLGLSQFADYRGVAIGVDDYAGIESVAAAPEVDRKELGTAHAYLMIPVAVIAIGMLWLAVRRGRWQLCRLVALIGIAVIAVSIFIDRPAGLDEGDLSASFSGVEAQILGGWWTQLFAGIGLALSSLLLAAEIRRSPASVHGRSPRRARREGEGGARARRGRDKGREGGPRESRDREEGRKGSRRRGLRRRNRSRRSDGPARPGGDAGPRGAGA